MGGKLYGDIGCAQQHSPTGGILGIFLGLMCTIVKGTCQGGKLGTGTSSILMYVYVASPTPVGGCVVDGLGAMAAH